MRPPQVASGLLSEWNGRGPPDRSSRAPCARRSGARFCWLRAVLTRRQSLQPAMELGPSPLFRSSRTAYTSHPQTCISLRTIKNELLSALSALENHWALDWVLQVGCVRVFGDGLGFLCPQVDCNATPREWRSVGAAAMECQIVVETHATRWQHRGHFIPIPILKLQILLESIKIHVEEVASAHPP